MAALGLRGKSLLALLLSCLLAFAFAGFIGYQALEGVQSRFGEAYAKNLVQLNRERVFAPVSRELALAQRLAGSQITLAWLQNEQDPAWRELFFREAAAFQQTLSDHLYFAASARGQGYYANGPGQEPSQQPRYRLEQGNPRDAWFFQALRETTPYQINVDRSVVTGELKVWFNVLVHGSDGQALGLVGSGLDLSHFVKQFTAADKSGVESMVLDVYGSILIHPDQDLVTLNAAQGRSLSTSLLGMLTDPEDATEVRGVMSDARQAPGEVMMLKVAINGAPRLLALSWIPEL